jgi:hypothetical protein
MDDDHCVITECTTLSDLVTNLPTSLSALLDDVARRKFVSADVLLKNDRIVYLLLFLVFVVACVVFCKSVQRMFAVLSRDTRLNVSHLAFP